MSFIENRNPRVQEPVGPLVPDDRPKSTHARDEGEPLAPPTPHFTPREEVIKAFADLPAIDFKQFRADIYATVDPSPRDWFED